jgi:hypothetical protein
MMQWLTQFEPVWLMLPEALRFVLVTLLKIGVLLVPLKAL